MRFADSLVFSPAQLTGRVWPLAQQQLQSSSWLAVFIVRTFKGHESIFRSFFSRRKGGRFRFLGFVATLWSFNSICLGSLHFFHPCSLHGRHLHYIFTFDEQADVPIKGFAFAHAHRRPAVGVPPSIPASTRPPNLLCPTLRTPHACETRITRYVRPLCEQSTKTLRAPVMNPDRPSVTSV